MFWRIHRTDYDDDGDDDWSFTATFVHILG